ncbi:MAG: tetratricopeptide repeat protein [Ottowia sp.]|uniref:tetratricopeptide repeat protein n=1 Tax=Ottowia sp. TaxID=1898956 RepID=UPI003C78F071
MDYYGLMHHFFRVFPLLTLVSGMAFAQAPKPAQPASDAVPPAAPASAASAAETPRPSALTARLLYELLVGELSFQDGEANQGIALMLDAARRTHDSVLYKRAVEMAIQSRSGSMAMDAVRAWRQAEPRSPDANRLELQVMVALGRIAESDAPLRATLAALPTTDQEPFILAVPSLYTRAIDKAEAAQVVERGLADVLQNPALAPAAWTSIGRMRLATNDRTGALSAANLGQTANPKSEWPALLALQLMTGADEPNAEPLIKRYLRNATPKPEVRIGYARALVDAGRGKEAHEQLAELTRNQPDYPEGWLAQGALYAQERHDTEAETALKRYLELATQPSADERFDRSNGRNQARMTLAQIAERRGDYAAAESMLAKIDSPDEAINVQLRRATILARQGQLDEAVQLIRSVPVRTPEDARMKITAEAQLLRENKRPQQAYDLLQSELSKDPEDEDLLYDTAMAAEKLDRLDEMEQLIRKLIEIKPDAFNAYNALGYTFADRNLRLPEAKQLIEKAVELSPDDPFIQDSLGWVEFRLGNRAQALRILQAAFAKRPDAEIAAHLGEVLWTMGRKDEAIVVLRNGVRLNAENETLQETLQRLKINP